MGCWICYSFSRPIAICWKHVRLAYCYTVCLSIARVDCAKTKQRTKTNNHTVAKLISSARTGRKITSGAVFDAEVQGETGAVRRVGKNHDFLEKSKKSI